MSHLTHAKTVTFILTKDQAKAKQFYQDVLGLAFVSNDGFADVFELAGTILRITQIEGYQAGPHPVLGWEVADITAACQELIAAGVTMTIYDGFGQNDLGIWTSPDGAAKVAWFNDSDGNVLSLTQC